MLATENNFAKSSFTKDFQKLKIVKSLNKWISIQFGSFCSRSISLRFYNFVSFQIRLANIGSSIEFIGHILNGLNPLLPFNSKEILFIKFNLRLWTWLVYLSWALEVAKVRSIKSFSLLAHLNVNELHFGLSEVTIMQSFKENIYQWLWIWDQFG